MRNSLYMPARAGRLFLFLKGWRSDLNIGAIYDDEAKREGFGSGKEFVKAYKAMHGGLMPSWAFNFQALCSADGPLLHPEKRGR
jgi:hypothetical protein